MGLSVVALGDVFEVDHDGPKGLERLWVLLPEVLADPSSVRQLSFAALTVVLDDKVQQLDLWRDSQGSWVVSGDSGFITLSLPLDGSAPRYHIVLTTIGRYATNFTADSIPV